MSRASFGDLLICLKQHISGQDLQKSQIIQWELPGCKPHHPDGFCWKNPKFSRSRAGKNMRKPAHLSGKREKEVSCAQD